MIDDECLQITKRLGHSIKFQNGALVPKLHAGQRYGRLVVILPWGYKSLVRAYLCKCDCGKITQVRGDSLQKGDTKSCGCLRVELITKHGQAGHAGKRSTQYIIYHGLIRRCTDKKCRAYKKYGGRGIKVCDRWLDSFENFYADMGGRPSKKHSIDRIDNNGNYCKENCRWATRGEQQRNTQRNINITHDGKTMCLTDWCIELKMSKGALTHRIKKWGSLSKALDQPVNENRRENRIGGVLIAYRGQTKRLGEWAVDLGITSTNLGMLMKKYKDPEIAFAVKKRNRKKKTQSDADVGIKGAKASK